MKGKSLRSQIVRYSMISFGITFLFILAALLFNQYLSLKQALDFEGNKLLATAVKQAEQILPGLLVAEEYGSVDLQLSRIKESEELTKISYVAASDGALPSITSCPKTGRTYSCVSYVKSQILTATEVGLPGETMGYLIKQRSMAYLRGGQRIMFSVAVLFGGISIVFLVLMMSLLAFVDRHLRQPLLALKDHLGPVLDGDKGSKLGSFAVAEVQTVADQVQELVEKFQEKKVAAAQGELAAQVAHDIRSPLTLLNLIARESEGLSTEHKKLLELAAGRINLIASSLLDKYRKEKRQPKVVISFVLSIAEKIVAEKRAMHRAANIELEVEPSSAQAFVGASSTELGRAFSNLIENGIEARDQDAAVVVIKIANAPNSSISIEITDNGKGMTPEAIATFGQRGMTSGKIKGNGLGAHHAKTLVESIGGSFKVLSELGKGTTIRLVLPKTESPNWFCGNIPLNENHKLIVIDDDQSIHALWSQKFGARLQAKFSDLCDSLLGQLNDSNTFFLVDNQISSNGQKGLAFIEENHLSYRSVLVTNDFEDEDIQARCARIGCRIVPKNLILYLDVDVPLPWPEQAFDLVLIDNDELMRMSWMLCACDLQKKIGIFENVNDFMAANVAPMTPVYIDLHLQNGINGLNVAEQLNKIGYDKLFITTGDETVRDLPPYIKSIRGKDFPVV